MYFVLENYFWKVYKNDCPLRELTVISKENPAFLKC